MRSVLIFKRVVAVTPLNLANPRFKSSFDWLAVRKRADGVNTSPD